MLSCVTYGNGLKSLEDRSLTRPAARAMQGKYDEAGSLCEDSLAIREKLLGPEHPDVATVLQNWADCLAKTVRAV